MLQPRANAPAWMCASSSASPASAISTAQDSGLSVRQGHLCQGIRRITPAIIGQGGCLLQAIGAGVIVALEPVHRRTGCFGPLPQGNVGFDDREAVRQLHNCRDQALDRRRRLSAVQFGQYLRAGRSQPIQVRQSTDAGHERHVLGSADPAPAQQAIQGGPQVFRVAADADPLHQLDRQKPIGRQPFQGARLHRRQNRLVTHSRGNVRRSALGPAGEGNAAEAAAIWAAFAGR